MSRAKGGHTGVNVEEVPGALLVVDHREVEAGQAWGEEGGWTKGTTPQRDSEIRENNG